MRAPDAAQIAVGQRREDVLLLHAAGHVVGPDAVRVGHRLPADLGRIALAGEIVGTEHEAAALAAARRHKTAVGHQHAVADLDRRTDAPAAGTVVGHKLAGRQRIALGRPRGPVIVGVLQIEADLGPLGVRLLAEVVEDIHPAVGRRVQRGPGGLTHFFRRLDRILRLAPGAALIAAPRDDQRAVGAALGDGAGGDDAQPGAVATVDHVGLVVVAVAEDQPAVVEVAGVGGFRPAVLQVAPDFVRLDRRELPVVDQQLGQQAPKRRASLAPTRIDRRQRAHHLGRPLRRIPHRGVDGRAGRRRPGAEIEARRGREFDRRAAFDRSRPACGAAAGFFLHGVAPLAALILPAIDRLAGHGRLERTGVQPQGQRACRRGQLARQTVLAGQVFFHAQHLARRQAPVVDQHLGHATAIEARRLALGHMAALTERVTLAGKPGRVLVGRETCDRDSVDAQAHAAGGRSGAAEPVDVKRRVWIHQGRLDQLVRLARREVQAGDEPRFEIAVAEAEGVLGRPVTKRVVVAAQQGAPVACALGLRGVFGHEEECGLGPELQARQVQEIVLAVELQGRLAGQRHD